MRVGTFLGLGLTLFALAALNAGCAASKNTSGGGTGGQTSAGGGGTGGGVGAGTVGGTGGGGGFQECNKFTAEASQAPAAMLIALDASPSMSTNLKWATAQQAIIAAIDKDVFDSMSIGIVTFPVAAPDPGGMVAAPACISGFVQKVSCGVSGLPDVSLAPAGVDKSNASSGVRHDIFQYLKTHSPLSNPDDGSPVYDGMALGYNVLKQYGVSRRIMLLITDGGFSCTSVSNRPGYSDGLCPDWEYPDSVNSLIVANRTDPNTPIFTFVVGVPGSNSAGEQQGPYATAPYHMRLALSTYAVSGSPDTVDPACDKALQFTKNGGDPALPCHIDLSGNSFDANALANAIQTIRGKALGCVYDLPPPPSGQEIDKGLVNVDVTLDGATSAIPQRSDPNDACAADGCWDYNVGGQVQILGKTCDEISKATAAKVDIRVGCQTIVK